MSQGRRGNSRRGSQMSHREIKNEEINHWLEETMSRLSLDIAQPSHNLGPQDLAMKRDIENNREFFEGSTDFKLDTQYSEKNYLEEASQTSVLYSPQRPRIDSAPVHDFMECSSPDKTDYPPTLAHKPSSIVPNSGSSSYSRSRLSQLLEADGRARPYASDEDLDLEELAHTERNLVVMTDFTRYAPSDIQWDQILDLEPHRIAPSPHPSSSINPDSSPSNVRGSRASYYTPRVPEWQCRRPNPKLARLKMGSDRHTGTYRSSQAISSTYSSNQLSGFDRWDPNFRTSYPPPSSSAKGETVASKLVTVSDAYPQLALPRSVYVKLVGLHPLSNEEIHYHINTLLHSQMLRFDHITPRDRLILGLLIYASATHGKETWGVKTGVDPNAGMLQFAKLDDEGKYLGNIDVNYQLFLQWLLEWQKKGKLADSFSPDHLEDGSANIQRRECIGSNIEYNSYRYIHHVSDTHDENLPRRGHSSIIWPVASSQPLQPRPGRSPRRYRKGLQIWYDILELLDSHGISLNQLQERDYDYLISLPKEKRATFVKQLRREIFAGPSSAVQPVGGHCSFTQIRDTQKISPELAQVAVSVPLPSHLRSGSRVTEVHVDPEDQSTKTSVIFKEQQKNHKWLSSRGWCSWNLLIKWAIGITAASAILGVILYFCFFRQRRHE